MNNYGSSPRIARRKTRAPWRSHWSAATIPASPGVHALVRIVIRRLKWFIGSVLIFEILALIITSRTVTVYEATATIELNQTSGSSLGEGLGELASQQIGGDEDGLLVDQQTETAILQGDSLALAVIDRLGLASQLGSVPCQGRPRSRDAISGRRIARDSDALVGYVQG